MNLGLFATIKNTKLKEDFKIETFTFKMGVIFASNYLQP